MSSRAVFMPQGEFWSIIRSCWKLEQGTDCFIEPHRIWVVPDEFLSSSWKLQQGTDCHIEPRGIWDVPDEFWSIVKLKQGTYRLIEPVRYVCHIHGICPMLSRQMRVVATHRILVAVLSVLSKLCSSNRWIDVTGSVEKNKKIDHAGRLSKYSKQASSKCYYVNPTVYMA